MYLRSSSFIHSKTDWYYNIENSWKFFQFIAGRSTYNVFDIHLNLKLMSLIFLFIKHSFRVFLLAYVHVRTCVGDNVKYIHNITIKKCVNVVQHEEK